MTRDSSHFFESSENGSNPYQPWLATVRRKLKFFDLGIFNSIWVAF